MSTTLNDEEINFDDFEDMEEDFIDNSGNEMIASFYENASNTAINLTEFVIENNRYNEKKMTEEDIYEIHGRSFTAAVNAIIKNPIA
jgi:hypothetical protein